MINPDRIARLDLLKGEFRRLLDFHASSFKELDDKARYWLTITLPSFLALSAFLLESHSELGNPLIGAGTALATCLLASSIFFALVLLSSRIESGVLTPTNRDFESVREVLEDDDKWFSIVDDQAAQLLSAVKNNENANNKKSRRLSRAETSLFLATPTAVTLAAACAALAYSAAGPFSGGSTAAASAGAIGGAASAVGIGFASGAVSTLAALAIRHLATLRKKSTDSSP